MEARLHSSCPLSSLNLRYVFGAHPRCEHVDIVVLLQKGLHQRCSLNGLLPPWGWSRGNYICPLS